MLKFLSSVIRIDEMHIVKFYTQSSKFPCVHLSGINERAVKKIEIALPFDSSLAEYKEI